MGKSWSGSIPKHCRLAADNYISKSRSVSVPKHLWANLDPDQFQNTVSCQFYLKIMIRINSKTLSARCCQFYRKIMIRTNSKTLSTRFWQFYASQTRLNEIPVCRQKYLAIHQQHQHDEEIETSFKTSAPIEALLGNYDRQTNQPTSRTTNHGHERDHSI